MPLGTEAGFFVLANWFTSTQSRSSTKVKVKFSHSMKDFPFSTMDARYEVDIFYRCTLPDIFLVVCQRI